MPRKLEISIPSQGEWDNHTTKYPPDSDIVPVNALTEGSKNYETHEKGVLTKRKGSIEYSTLSSVARDQYEAIFNDGVRHLITVQNGTVEYSPGDGTTNSVTNGSGFTASANFEFATMLNKVYMGNGANAGQVYDKTISYGGVSYAGTLPRLKAMGCQVPGSAPTFNSFVAGGSIPNGSYNYKVTFMYYDTEESNGSASSSPVINVVAPNSTVKLNIPQGGYGVTSRKIYREDNAIPGVWRLVGEVTNNSPAATFNDTEAVGTSTIPTDNNIPPTFGLIATFLDRSWIADITGEPHTVRHSEAAFPDIFLSTNYIDCNQRDPITAIYVFLDRLIVFNRNSMGQILGTTSDTFRYAEIQSSIGCVDTRSIQVRTIQGVPMLIWLSDKGMYAYNGNSINYISEPIEDIVNLNIQQGVQTKGQNSQTEQADFQGGTPSPGIDLISDPGAITTPNPRKLWDDKADWEGGETLTNISTNDTLNKIQIPTRFAPTLAEGQLSNVYIDLNSLKLDVYASSYTGESNNAQANKYRAVNVGGVNFTGVSYAIPIKVPRNGTLTSLFLSVGVSGSMFVPPSWKYKIWADSGGNAPGSELYTSGAYSSTYGGLRVHSVTLSPSIELTAGIKYWIGVEAANSTTSIYAPALPAFTNGDLKGKIAGSSVWWPLAPISSLFGMPAYTNGFNFSQKAVAKSGQWLSPIYDTKSDSVSNTLNITHTASYPASTSAITTVEGSDEDDFDGGAEVSESVNSLNGNQNLSISGKRYWRVRIQLDTNDDRVTPTVNTPILKFNSTGSWISDPIDCTGDNLGATDCTTYNSLDVVSNVPGGTALTIEVRTATTQAGLAAAPWVAFGAAVVRQWFQVRASFTSDASNIYTPSISSIDFKYTIVANLVSSAINTAINPAGWDVFEETSSLNGGTIVFEMRSAAALGGLPGATWYTVTNGVLPTSSLPTDQYVQWRTTLTSTADAVPEVNSVVINWLISESDPIRVASLFYDRSYFLTAAELGQTTNNIVIILDGDGKWRIWRGLNVNTLTLFFNSPYYGDAITPKIYKLFQGLKDKGSANIELDIRSKAFDFSTSDYDNRDKYKVMLDLVVTGKSTGATYSFYYSIDEGFTWKPLKFDDGTTSFTSSTDLSRFIKRVKAQHNIGEDIAGRTIMFRAVNNDDKEVELHKFKMRVLLRKGEPLG